MNIKNFLVRTISELYKSVKRFPITIALCASVVAILIMISETQLHLGYDSEKLEVLQRIAMVLALGVPLTLCIKVIFEKHKQTNLFLEGISLAVSAGFLAFYYFFLLKDFNMVPITRYIGITFFLYLCFIFIPYLVKREHFEMYVIQLLSRFAITIIYSVVLFLGISAILFTIDKLLGVTIDSKLYYYTWLFIVGIFSPVYFLAGVPSTDESMEDYDYTGFFKILLLYIVMPLLTIYMTILYIYFAKIIITQTWPVGLVSHLVLWYSTLCVVVIFLITPIKNNIWVEKFIFFLPKLILPILIMMFISMGIRVNAYGITENRYFVLLLGLWVFGIMIYISFKKVKRNILIPISLSIIAFISVLGPVSAYSVSKLSQNNRLSSILSQNGMLTANKTIQPSPTISEKDQKEISAILSYFEKNHNLDDVKYLDKDFAIKDMNKVFGFEYKDQWQNGRNENYFSYNSPNPMYDALDISEYDYLFNMSTYKNILNKEPLKIEYVSAKQEVNIYNGNDMLYRLSLSQFADQLRAKYPSNTKVDQKDMIFIDENQNIKVQFIFSNIYGQRIQENDGIKVDGADFYILIKLKK